MNRPIDITALVPGVTRLQHRNPDIARLYGEPGVYLGPHPVWAKAMVVDCAGYNGLPVAAHVDHWLVVDEGPDADLVDVSCTYTVSG